MEEVRKALQACWLFRDLPEEGLETLAGLGRRRRFGRGALLIEPQETVDWFGVVLSGRVLILQMFSDGVSSLMNTLRPGYVLGADLICTDSLRSPYTAMADGDGALLVFSRTALLEPGTLPEAYRLMVWGALLRFLSHENMRKHYRLAILSRRGLRDRVLTWLTMQTRRRGTNQFQAGFSREELADFLCVNRSALSHELSKMAAEGLIAFHRNEFTLLEAGEALCTWRETD